MTSAGGPSASISSSSVRPAKAVSTDSAALASTARRSVFSGVRGRGPRELEEVVDEVGRAEGLPLHLLQDRVARIARGGLRKQHLGVRGKAGDRRVDLVGHAGRQHARARPAARARRARARRGCGRSCPRRRRRGGRASRGTRRPRAAGRARRPRPCAAASRSATRLRSPGGVAEVDAGQDARERQAAQLVLAPAGQQRESRVRRVDPLVGVEHRRCPTRRSG